MSNEHEPKEPKKDVSIIVNGHRRTWPKGKICFEDVIKLAFDPVPIGENVEFAVGYMRGHSNHEDTFDPGDCVEVVEGMEFHVTQTNRS